MRVYVLVVCESVCVQYVGVCVVCPRISYTISHITKHRYYLSNQSLFSLSSPPPPLSLSLSLSLSPSYSSCGTGVNIMDYDIVVREFKPKSCYHIHFRANTIWEGYEALYLSSCGLNSITDFLLQGRLWQITHEGWYAIKQRNQPIQLSLSLYIYIYIYIYTKRIPCGAWEEKN